MLALLTSCASQSIPVPKGISVTTLTEFPHRVLVTETQSNPPPIPFIIRPIWQIVVQKEGASLRWLRFDPLGIPDARQILQQGRWRNDGFIYPNPQAREMFAALLFAWVPEQELNTSYGKQNWRNSPQADGSINRALFHQGQARWIVHWPSAESMYKNATFSIKHADGTVWKVSPLATEEESQVK
ncbi:hypothetical protein [Cephaloticoccus primus]|uniref:hypothetical protein n=1 Tax=Cephaloticoccus primus TaxID=1548207 RepID=UPI0012E723E9|nr:hypothetical protein [Cephaloticoccus primus]